ncbi:ParA family protein [Sphingomonas sp. NIC1]|uniref:ParA family protein n=1 Tax=Sphingomonas sp. NIC1 TaxID=1961362 RepID=UPI000AB33A5D|nr:ParA family protein [Sphingomonas sp. NIC1]
MKTIAINVEKGGAGKTMIACHLAWVLADAGHRVLFLDLDRQCNATDALADFESLGRASRCSSRTMCHRPPFRASRSTLIGWVESTTPITPARSLR